MENKKVKNATKCVYEGIQFNSELEMKSYILLKKEGLNPQYEPRTFTILEGKNFSVPCYDLHNDRKLKRNVWGINTYKSQSIKYTPDFIFFIYDESGVEIMVVIEAKGHPNDRYIYVKKLFRTWLEMHHPNSLFFETHNLKQLKAAIEIIKTIKHE